MINTADIMWFRDVSEKKEKYENKTEIVLRFQRENEDNILYVQETLQEIKKMIESPSFEDKFEDRLVKGKKEIVRVENPLTLTYSYFERFKDEKKFFLYTKLEERLTRSATHWKAMGYDFSTMIFIETKREKLHKGFLWTKEFDRGYYILEHRCLCRIFSPPLWIEKSLNKGNLGDEEEPLLNSIRLEISKDEEDEGREMPFLHTLKGDIKINVGDLLFEENEEIKVIKK